MAVWILCPDAIIRADGFAANALLWRGAGSLRRGDCHALVAASRVDAWRGDHRRGYSRRRLLRTPQANSFTSTLPGPGMTIFRAPPLTAPIVAPTLKTTADTPAQSTTEATTQTTVQPVVHACGLSLDGWSISVKDGCQWQSKKPRSQLRTGRFMLETAGQGEPVLLIHGGTASAREWRPVLEGLGRHAQCVAIDRLGCGHSGSQRSWLRSQNSDRQPLRAG